MVSIHRRHALALGLAFPWAAAGLAEAAATPRYPALQALLDDYVAKRRLPGAVVAVQRGRADPDFLSAGTLAFDAPAKAGPRSLYRIYSMTKPVTGVAAMI